jgi:hypothetical protein
MAAPDTRLAQGISLPSVSEVANRVSSTTLSTPSSPEENAPAIRGSLLGRGHRRSTSWPSTQRCRSAWTATPPYPWLRSPARLQWNRLLRWLQTASGAGRRCPDEARRACSISSSVLRSFPTTSPGPRLLGLGGGRTHYTEQVFDCQHPVILDCGSSKAVSQRTGDPEAPASAVRGHPDSGATASRSFSAAILRASSTRTFTNSY